jgi:hypothetical protein
MEYVMKKRSYICTAKLRNIQTFLEYWILYLLRMQCQSSIHPNRNGIGGLYRFYAKLVPAADDGRQGMVIWLTSG